MAASTITFVFSAPRDLVSSKHASHPENFTPLINLLKNELAKELGPDASLGLTFTSLTVT